MHACKLCDDGVVVMGEYGITAALFDAGYTIDTLMSKYGDVDWKDRSNWNCNDQVRLRTQPLTWRGNSTPLEGPTRACATVMRGCGSAAARVGPNCRHAHAPPTSTAAAMQRPPRPHSSPT